MGQGFGPLPPGAAPQQPRLGGGLYGPFGMPDKLTAIHFPTADNTSKPWYWYLDRQQPQEFSFLAVPTVSDHGTVSGGAGWIRLPDFSIIRILQADTQTLHGIPLIGATSLEDAVTNKASQADTAWGRIDFHDQRFWAAINGFIRNEGASDDGFVKGIPAFDQIKGLIVDRPTNKGVSKQISAATALFAADWNSTSAAYNAVAAKVDPTAGFQYHNQKSAFAIPLPSGPPTDLTTFSLQLNLFAQGPPYSVARVGIDPVKVALNQPSFTAGLPPTAFFNINTLTTGAYAVTLKMGQLDDKTWDMSVFPPEQVLPAKASFVTKDYSGFGHTSFPLSVSFS